MRSSCENNHIRPSFFPQFSVESCGFSVEKTVETVENFDFLPVLSQSTFSTIQSPTVALLVRGGG
jgi:hypothetical protein